MSVEDERTFGPSGRSPRASVPVAYPSSWSRTARIPDDFTVWAFSDVHGQTAALRAALNGAGIVDESGTWIGGQNVGLVGCGDYIDRGPDSGGMIKFLKSLGSQARRAGSKLVLVRGNHEQMFADVLRGDPTWFDSWLCHGGLQTLESFRTSPPDNAAQLFERVAGSSRLVRWLLATGPYALWRDVLFVHAGPRPQTGVSGLANGDWVLWHSAPFLDSPGLTPGGAFDRLAQSGLRRVVMGHLAQPARPRLFHGGSTACIDGNAGYARADSPSALILFRVPPRGSFAKATYQSAEV